MSRRQFKIIREIAEGGFGKVYLAELISADQQFSRVVAFKLLHEKWSTHDEVLSRTRDEARLLGLLRNDHIVKVEDLTSINGQCAIVMEYLEGVDLKWLIQFLAQNGQRCPLRSVFEIVQATADALWSAYNGVPLHSEHSDQPLRVIHRDIKPSNILVTTTGQVKVLDFGTARANFAKREAHTQELAFGSQGYMAPERMLGEEDTPAADIFSLGITMYELLALENFGKIPPRPAKYKIRLDEQLAALSIPGPEPLAHQVREVLRDMLAYSTDDRPSAERVVDVMEHLASEAGDTPLRKFGRTVVVQARDAMPEPQSVDSLAGTVVHEDISASQPIPRSTPGQSSGSHASPSELSRPSESPPKRRAPRELPPTVKRDFSSMSPGPSPVDASGPRPSRGDSPISILPEEPGRRRIVLAASLIGGLGLAALLLAVIGIAVYLILQIIGPKPTSPSVFVVVEPGEATEDMVRTTLISEPASAFRARLLQGELGFTGEWTGPERVDIELPAGTYQTYVERPEGESIYGNFELKDEACIVTLDLEASRWETACD